jgi:hypothetical protein
MKKIDHLSVSQVSMFSRCEFQWFLKYIESIAVPVHSALIRGKAIHSGLASIYLSKQTNRDYHVDEVLDIVVNSIEHADSKENIIWDKAKSLVKDIAVKMMNSYINDKHPDNIKSEDIESVESKFSYDLFTDKGESFNIIGYPDLVLKDRIIDFKTTSRKPSKIDLGNKFQTAFYSTVSGKTVVELQYLIIKKQPETVSLVSNIDKEIKSISRIIFIKVYNKLIQSLRTGNFLPTGLFHPWACNYCGYADHSKCPYYISSKTKIA